MNQTQTVHVAKNSSANPPGARGVPASAPPLRPSGPQPQVARKSTARGPRASGMPDTSALTSLRDSSTNGNHVAQASSRPHQQSSLRATPASDPPRDVSSPGGSITAGSSSTSAGGYITGPKHSARKATTEKATAGKATAGKATAGKATAGKATAGKATAGKAPLRPRKPRLLLRAKSGTVALQEIKRLRNSTDLLIPRLPFVKLVAEILQDFKSDYRVKLVALDALQEGTEQFLTSLFEKVNLCCLHRKRITIKPRDLFLALRGEHKNDALV